MDAIEQTVKKYLEKKTENALLIQAPWGTGKTYFVKNTLKDIVERQPNKIFIYTTAYGINSYDEIIAQIFAAKYGISKFEDSSLGRSTLGLAKGIGKFFKITDDLVDKRDFLNMENDVIIIDDIERISFESLSILDFLGKTTSLYTEHANIKVIFVSDEEELILAIGDKKDDYLRTKEKSVWRTISYIQDLPEILTNMIRELNMDDKEQTFLLEHRPYIVDICRTSETKNLRTIKFFFDIIEEIMKVIGLVKFKKIPYQIFQTAFILSNEYKTGNLLPAKGEAVPKYLSSWWAIQSRAYEDVKSELNNADVVKQSILKKYDNVFQKLGTEYTFLRSLYTFVVNGQLHKDILRNEIDGIIGNHDIETEWNKSMNTIKKFKQIKEETFIEEYQNVIEYIEQGKYDLYTLSVFLNFSMYFIEQSIQIPFSSPDELIEFVDSHLDKSADHTEFEDREINDLTQKYREHYPKITGLFNRVQKILESKTTEMFIENSRATKKTILKSDWKLEGYSLWNMFLFLPDDELNEIAAMFADNNAYSFKLIQELEKILGRYDKDRNTQLRDGLLSFLAKVNERIDADKFIASHNARKLENIIQQK